MNNNTNLYQTVSEKDFDNVYHYIEIQIQKFHLQFYTCENYEIYLKENLKIILKKEGFTLSIISKENGIFSLAKTHSQNRNMVIETSKLFLDILDLCSKN